MHSVQAPVLYTTMLTETGYAFTGPAIGPAGRRPRPAVIGGRRENIRLPAAWTSGRCPQRLNSAAHVQAARQANDSQKTSALCAKVPIPA